MRSFAAKISWGRALGVYLHQDRITVAEVVGSPRGTIVLDQYSYPIDAEGPGATLKRLLEERLTPRQRRGAGVCVGIGAEQTFFTTRPFATDAPNADGPTAEQVLMACSSAGTWEPGRTLADIVLAKPLGKQVYSVAACRRELGEVLVEALKSAGVRHYRLEPAPWSVLDAAEYKGKSPRKWKVAVHVLLEAPVKNEPPVQEPAPAGAAPPTEVQPHADGPAKEEPPAAEPKQCQPSGDQSGTTPASGSAEKPAASPSTGQQGNSPQGQSVAPAITAAQGDPPTGGAAGGKGEQGPPSSAPGDSAAPAGLGAPGPSGQPQSTPAAQDSPRAQAPEAGQPRQDPGPSSESAGAAPAGAGPTAPTAPGERPGPAVQVGGLALLATEGQPVLWRRFASATGQEAMAIASAARSLLVHAVGNLGVRHVGGIILHGATPPDLVDKVIDETGMEVAAAGGAGLSAELYSLGLALSERKKALKPMNLFQSLSPPPTIRDIFPWRLAGFIGLLVGAMALMLLDKSMSLASQCQQLSRQNDTHTWAGGKGTPAVDSERKKLSTDVSTIAKFLGTRILWSEYMRDLPTRLPPNACLSTITGLCEMKEMGKKKETAKKTNKSLTLRGVALYERRAGSGDRPLPESSVVPRDIDTFLESLRNVELLRRDFPLVTLADIRWKREGDNEVASFTIMALPREKSGGGEGDE